MFTFDAYSPDQWHDFFLTVGGGAAALAGLVFVALSINLESITHDQIHRSRAVGTLTGFAAVFMICAFALMGNQTSQAIGVEWAVLSAFAFAVYVKGIFRARKKGAPINSVPWHRVIIATVCYLAQIVGSLSFATGHSAGLLVAAIAMVLSFASLISGAWLLIVGIHDKTPHH